MAVGTDPVHGRAGRGCRRPNAGARPRRGRPRRGRVRGARSERRRAARPRSETRRCCTRTRARISSGRDSFDWGDVDGAFAAADRIVRSTSCTSIASRRHRSSAAERSSSTSAPRGSGTCTATTSSQGWRSSSWRRRCGRRWTGSGSSRTTSAADSVTRSSSTHTYSSAACSPGSSNGRSTGPSGEPITTWRTRTGTSGGSTTSRSRCRTTATILAYRMKAVDDCGAFPRYEPIGCVVWAQVAAGCYRIRNAHVDFAQVCTNKSPCGPNRGYSRLQHLWFIERMLDIVGHELGVDPVEIRKRNYVRPDEMPYRRERMRLRLGRLPACARHRARDRRLRRVARASGGGRKTDRGRVSARRSTRARTTSPRLSS